MNLRDLLLASGVASKDIELALRQSRQFVARVGSTARVLGAACEKVGQTAPMGSRKQMVAVVGSAWLSKVAEGSEDMLRQRGKRSPR